MRVTRVRNFFVGGTAFALSPVHINNNENPNEKNKLVTEYENIQLTLHNIIIVSITIIIIISISIIIILAIIKLTKYNRGVFNVS